MNAKTYKILYFIFLICVILYGRVYIGIFTPRQFMTIVMIIANISIKGLYCDKYLKLNYSFIIFYLISSILDSNIMDFIHSLLGSFLVSIVLYQSTKAYICKFNFNVLDIFKCLSVIGLINAMTTISQVFMPTSANRIISLMQVGEIESWNYFSIYHAGDEIFSHSMTGLFESAVHNGEYGIIFCLFPLILLYKSEKAVYKILWIGIAIMNYIGLFACQQRISFVCVTLSICYYLLRVAKYKPIFVGFLGILSFYIYNIIDLDSLGRISDLTEDGIRNDINLYNRDFIENNFLFGGMRSYMLHTNFHPHNFFYNSIIFGGLGGLISMLLLIYFLSIQLAKTIFNRHINCILLLLSLSLLCIIANSIFHNSSFATGDPLVWFVCGLFVFSKKLKESSM